MRKDDHSIDPHLVPFASIVIDEGIQYGIRFSILRHHVLHDDEYLLIASCSLERRKVRQLGKIQMNGDDAKARKPEGGLR